MRKIILIAGVPGSGKTWVTDQLTNEYEVMKHDDYINHNYVNAIIREARNEGKPILIETPFSISQIIEPIQKVRLKVEVVCIIEDESVLEDRYMKREFTIIPMGHLTRNQTYYDRAQDKGYFYGPSESVLKHLKTQV